MSFKTGCARSIKDACFQYIKDNRIGSRTMLSCDSKRGDFSAIYSFVRHNAPIHWMRIKTPRASVRRCIQELLPGYARYRTTRVEAAAAATASGMDAIVFEDDSREKKNGMTRALHKCCYECAEKDSATPLVFSSKKCIAEDILRVLYSSNALFVSLCAPMQYGKTSVLIHLAYLALGASKEDIVAIGLEPSPRVSSVVVITGLNDKDWARQTTERFDKCFGNHNDVTVIHRGGMRKSMAMLTKVRDAIVIIDECHYGSGKKQTIKKVLEAAGLLSQSNLRSRNVRIVQVSATPDSTLMVPQSWEDPLLHKTIVADWNVDGYISPLTILTDGRCHAPMDLREIDNVHRVLDPFTDSTGGVVESGVIVIRCPSKRIDRDTVIRNFHRVKQEKYKSLHLFEHNCKTNAHDDIDKHLTEGPPQGMIVVCFISGFYRAAKTFPRHDHILAVHEPWRRTTASTATVTQSLLGRVCGYHGNRKILVYTFESSVREYIELVNNGFDYGSVDNYNSSTLRRKNGETRKCRPVFSSGICQSAKSCPNNNKTGRAIAYLIYSSAEHVKADFGGPTPSSEAPRELRQDNGRNPTVEYVLKRRWGLSKAKVSMRTVAAVDEHEVDVWVVYKAQDICSKRWDRVVQSTVPHWSRHETYVQRKE